MDKGKYTASTLLSNIDEAFYALDSEFRLTYLNRKASELWGKGREELLGKHFWSEFPEAVGSESYSAHIRVMQERRPVRFETLSLILARWVEVNLFPDVKGGLCCYFRDITKSKTAEATYRWNEARLAALMDAAQDFAILGLDEGCTRKFLRSSRYRIAVDTVWSVSEFCAKASPNSEQGKRRESKTSVAYSQAYLPNRRTFLIGFSRRKVEETPQTPQSIVGSLRTLWTHSHL